MEKTIKIARYRTVPYTVNYNGKSYAWSGSKGSKYDIKDIPQDVVDYLVMNSVSFTDGELAILDESEEAQETIENIHDKESYVNNTHTKEEIEKILTGNFKKMESDLGKITVPEEKKFVIEVAKEIKLDSAAKQKFLAEWVGVPVDILFSDDEE